MLRSLEVKASYVGDLSDNLASKHFNDQAKRYAAGDLREVYFYREQLNGHIERQYQPGQ